MSHLPSIAHQNRSNAIDSFWHEDEERIGLQNPIGGGHLWTTYIWNLCMIKQSALMRFHPDGLRHRLSTDEREKKHI